MRALIELVGRPRALSPYGESIGNEKASQMSTPETLASDPLIDPALLAQLAYQHPELQPVIVANPAAYTGLLEWISSYGTSEGKIAANQRLGLVAPDDVSATVTDTVENPVITTVASDYRDTSPLDPPEPTEEAEATKVIFTEEMLTPPDTDTTAVMDLSGSTSPLVPVGPPVDMPPPVAPAPTPLAVPPPYSFSTSPPLPPTNSASVPPLPPSTASSPQKKNTTAIIAAIMGVVIVALLALGAWYFFIHENNKAALAEQEAADARAAQLEAQLEEEKAAREELEKEQAVAEEAARLAEQQRIEDAEATQQQATQQQVLPSATTFPPPSNAVTAPWFISETGNIACILDANGTACTIYDAEFALSAQGCSSPPYTIRIPEQGLAEWACTMPPVPNDADGPVLEYSTSSTVGNGACLATFRGMSCWNTNTGSSFAIARSGFITGTNGLIPETDFPWR